MDAWKFLGSGWVVFSVPVRSGEVVDRCDHLSLVTDEYKKAAWHEGVVRNRLKLSPCRW